jgi:carbon storage regulator
MLILGRREGESILIEGGIRIVVVSCDRGGVRIGIEAPAETKILRGEIAHQVEAENMRATATAPAAAPWASALGIAKQGAPVKVPGKDIA